MFYWKLVRSIPSTAWHAFFSARPFPLSSDFSWDRSEHEIHKAILHAIDAADEVERASLVALLQDASELADEAGYRAILNACPAGAAIVDALSAMTSFEERALWTYWHHPDVFQKAQEIRFFDATALKHETRRHRLVGARTRAPSAVDVQAMAQAVARFYRRHEGCGHHVETELTRRHVDGSLQVTLYLDALAESREEFEHGQRRRRHARPSMELALVYHAEQQVVETAVRGGKRYHDMLLRAFVEYVLKGDVRTERLQPQTFDLDQLRHGVSVRRAAALGIERVRLKKLVLGAVDGSGLQVTVEVPAKPITTSAEKAALAFFGDVNQLRRAFYIVQATVSVHFLPEAGRRTRRPLYIEFRRDGTIKWGRISESERSLVEHLLIEWNLVDAPPSHEAKAA